MLNLLKSQSDLPKNTKQGNKIDEQAGWGASIEPLFSSQMCRTNCVQCISFKRPVINLPSSVFDNYIELMIKN